MYDFHTYHSDTIIFSFPVLCLKTFILKCISCFYCSAVSIATLFVSIVTLFFAIDYSYLFHVILCINALVFQQSVGGCSIYIPLVKLLCLSSFALFGFLSGLDFLCCVFVNKNCCTEILDSPLPCAFATHWMFSTLYTASQWCTLHFCLTQPIKACISSGYFWVNSANICRAQNFPLISSWHRCPS